MTIITATGPRAARQRPIVYAVGAAALALFVACSWFGEWRLVGPAHVAVEMMAAMMAIVVGSISIARFYSRDANEFLFIGTGFIGTGLLDAYHALTASPAIAAALSADPAELRSWTWTASRLFLSVLMMLSWDSARRERADPGVRPSALRVCTTVSVLAVFTFAAFSLLPFPAATHPDAAIARPAELVPGMIFLAALVLHLRDGRWRADAFQHHLVLSLMAGFTAQAFLVAFATNPAGSLSSGAHWLKAVSYVAVFTGLLQEIARSFRTAGQAEELQDFNERLSTRVLDMTHELVARNNELQNMVEELRDARDAAETANQAKSRFLATMSHELRTPLTAILGYCELLQEDAEARGEESRARDLSRIWQAGTHLLAVINDVLDLARIEAGRVDIEVGVIDVRELIDGVVETLGSSLEAGENDVIVLVSDDLPTLETDPTRLRQCVLNILSNAAKFCERGTVTIRATPDEVDGAEYIRFAVSDTGIGMSEAQVERIFVAFEQADGSTSRRYGGTGLGLAITRRLTGILGGEIDVTSRPGEGSTFELLIPCSLPDAQPRSSVEIAYGG